MAQYHPYVCGKVHKAKEYYDAGNFEECNKILLELISRSEYLFELRISWHADTSKRGWQRNSNSYFMVKCGEPNLPLPRDVVDDSLLSSIKLNMTSTMIENVKNLLKKREGKFQVQKVLRFLELRKVRIVPCRYSEKTPGVITQLDLDREALFTHDPALRYTEFEVMYAPFCQIREQTFVPEAGGNIYSWMIIRITA